jgi:uncharacterized integral membrane protein
MPGKIKPSLVQRLKIVGISVAALLVLIVVLQNTAAVETKILFITVTVPRAVLLFGTLIIGFIVGVLSANKILARSRKGTSSKGSSSGESN